MGRIKSTLVKRTAKQLTERSPELFGNTFTQNKEVLGSTMPSKKIRNKIAGYIARLRRAEEAAAKRIVKPKIQEEILTNL